ncbi:MAG: hypothetical protein IJE89_02845 [Bacilli bacterium]|nr:hypothetical protein [Bacilli bacterium]
MKQKKKHPIKDFYIGEIYLYQQFANLLSIETDVKNNNSIKQNFPLSGAIDFQRDLISRYIDWENRRTYEGFLTIFYKQGDKYICLHNGVTYELGTPIIIENLIPLTELLPQINTNAITEISLAQALDLFDTLFKEDESILYSEKEELTSDFYVGDIVLKERTLPEDMDMRVEYFNLPLHLMLSKNNLEIYSFGENNTDNTVYRCLFLRDGVDLYNINNNGFYNPNEDNFDSIIPFRDYLQEFKIPTPKDRMSIPKALTLFKKTI